MYNSLLLVFTFVFTIKHLIANFVVLDKENIYQPCINLTVTTAMSLCIVLSSNWAITGHLRREVKSRETPRCAQHSCAWVCPLHLSSALFLFLYLLSSTATGKWCHNTTYVTTELLQTQNRFHHGVNESMNYVRCEMECTSSHCAAGR